MKITEKVLWSLFCLAIIARAIFGIHFILLFLVGLLLCIFYFYFSVFILNNISLKYMFKRETYSKYSNSRIVGSIFIGFSYSLLSMALLFRVVRFPGTIFFLILSLIGLIAGLIFIILRIKRSDKSTSDFYLGVRIRNVIFIFLNLILLGSLFISKEYNDKIFPLMQSQSHLQ